MNAKNFNVEDIEKIYNEAKPSKFTMLKRDLVFKKIKRSATKGNNQVVLSTVLSTPDIYVWLIEKGFDIKKRKIYIHDEFGTTEKWEYIVSW